MEIQGGSCRCYEIEIQKVVVKNQRPINIRMQLHCFRSWSTNWLDTYLATVFSFSM